MSFDAGEVRLARSGHVYLADVGTTLPTSLAEALDSAFVDAGYLNEDGLTLSPDVTIKDVMAWQSRIPIKTALETFQFEFKYVAIQQNQTNVGLFLLSENWENSAGEGKLTIPGNPGLLTKSLVLEWTDDLSDSARLVVPSANLTKREDLKMTAKDEQSYGFTWRVVLSETNIAYLYTDNPDLVPAS